jgi:hypothetical protein
MAVDRKSAGKLSLLWGGRQQNPDILRNLLFWGAVLARNEKWIRIGTGDKPIILSSIPASSQLDRGIAFDEVRIKALFAQEDTDLDKAAAEVQANGETAEEGEDDDDEATTD